MTDLTDKLLSIIAILLFLIWARDVAILKTFARNTPYNIKQFFQKLISRWKSRA